jgi:hypothetical protein
MLGGYGAAAMSYDPALSAGVSSPGSATQQYDYTSAIDPALESATAPATAASNQFIQSTPGMPNFRNDLKREMQSASPYSSSGASDTPHLRGGAAPSVSPSVAFLAEDAADATFPAKRNVLDLLAMGGAPPPPAPQEQNPTSIDETKHLYYSIYAPGLENFLESKWFSIKGLNKFLGDKSLMDLFGSLLVQFQKPNNEEKEILYTNSVEARAVWALACNVRAGAAELNGAKSTGLVPPTDDPVEATHRLGVVETLLTGRVVMHNPLTQPVPGSTDHHRLRELEFWYTLANFVCLREDDPNSYKDIDDTLSALRTLLDGRENRDVLYSIAVVRAMGQRVSDYTASDMPHHLDETDDRSKLRVAKQFITDEASGNGTTNVIRRFCELATRTWSTTPAEASSASPAPKAET